MPFAPFMFERVTTDSAQRRINMTTNETPLSLRGLGIASIILGFFGGAMFWWTPLGMVLSLSGLLTGFVGWALARRKTPGFGLLLGGVLVCLVALILDSVVAGLGLEVVRFQALR
jgi:hypothetical protein